MNKVKQYLTGSIKEARDSEDISMIFPDGQKAAAGVFDTSPNNITAVVGAAGTGKTESCIKTNIAAFGGCMAVLDQKGRLAELFREDLEERGFNVAVLNTAVPSRSTHSYNPFDPVETNDDVVKTSGLIVDLTSPDSALRSERGFWSDCRKLFFAANIGALVEGMSGFRKDPAGLLKLMRIYSPKDVADSEKSKIAKMFAEHDREYRKRTGRPSWANQQFRKFLGLDQNIISCIIVEAQASFASFDSPEMHRLTCESDLDLGKMGFEKTAIFVQTSDTDRSKDLLINLFFNQMMNVMCDNADAQPEGRLPIPVMLMLDDFGTTAKIHNFTSMISNMRSRRISAIIALQAVSQLESYYGREWTAVMNNCDNLIYTGGNDPETASYFSRVFNVPIENIVDMPLKHHYMKRRGERSRFEKTKFFFDYCTGSAAVEM